MPSSIPQQLNDIVELIIDTNPKSILDVGVGFGKYGFLSREYLELWDGRGQYKDWRRRIDGIEVFKEYLTPIHDFVYNQAYVGNVLDILPTLRTRYDLILLIDILEHFEYVDGIHLLKECRKHGRNIIISTPKHASMLQRECFGNPFETHRFQWRKKHFRGFGSLFFVHHQRSIICYMGEDVQGVRKAQNSRALREILSAITKYF